MSRYIAIDGYSKPDVLGYIRVKLTTDYNWQIKALKYLYDHQTAHEKKVHKSIEENEIGFDKIDAVILTHIAKDVNAGKELNKYQKSILKARLPSYAEQIESQCDIKKLCRDLNLFYYGESIHIDSNSFLKYMRKLIKLIKNCNRIDDNNYILINSQKFEYKIEYKEDNNTVVISTKNKTIEFSCSRESFNKVIGYFSKGTRVQAVVTA